MEAQQRGLGRITIVGRSAIEVGRGAIARVPTGAQPTALALVLALIAWPIVATTWSVGYRGPYITGPPASGPLPWSSAAGGVFLSALVAGPIGGLTVRRNRIAGGLLTFCLALTVAIIGAQLLPAYLGQHVACFEVGLPCDPLTTTAQVVIDDLQSLPLLFLFGPLVEPVAVLTLALGVAYWSAVLAPSRRNARKERLDTFAW